MTIQGGIKPSSSQSHLRLLVAKSIGANEVTPFTFAYVERLLRRKNFGVLTTITSEGRSHSVEVVYAVSPPDQPFSI